MRLWKSTEKSGRSLLRGDKHKTRPEGKPAFQKGLTYDLEPLASGAGPYSKFNILLSFSEIPPNSGVFLFPSSILVSHSVDMRHFLRVMRDFWDICVTLHLLCVTLPTWVYPLHHSTPQATPTHKKSPLPGRLFHISF